MMLGVEGLEQTGTHTHKMEETVKLGISKCDIGRAAVFRRVIPTKDAGQQNYIDYTAT